MSFDETDLIERLQAVAEGFEMAPASLADDVRRGRRRVRRNRGLVMGALVAAVVVIVGVATALRGGPDGGSDRLEPVETPSVEVEGVPVWYDAEGLHRGDVVEETPVEIVRLDDQTLAGALALVRTGAVYLDPATYDVWFHPWGGEPRIVGHDSEAGPGGDPNGDTAAWFEGSDALEPGPGELVVYDTAAGREISRTSVAQGVSNCSGICGDHYPTGNGFLQVSAERIYWTSGAASFTHDVESQTTSEVESSDGRYVIDVHDDVEVLGENGDVVVTAPGRAEETYADLETHVRLSPSGNYVLASELTEDRHAAATVDTRTGELWRVPRNRYPWIAWSYGDIAMVDQEDGYLLACDVARQTCDIIRPEQPFLMPTN